jgi:hypothetical protein
VHFEIFKAFPTLPPLRGIRSWYIHQKIQNHLLSYGGRLLGDKKKKKKKKVNKQELFYSPEYSNARKTCSTLLVLDAALAVGRPVAGILPDFSLEDAFAKTFYAAPDEELKQG